ncbi:MAG: DNA primase [Clostridiales bacterium]|nr:DNA primase [Clostridiales bacterium]
MAFPEAFLDELVSRNDIADVVGTYVHLTKKSGSNMFGLCPFHSEKTPSFSVSQDKQIYHCFGCGKGGGVVNFIMEIENLSYPDAVQILAKRSGMTVPDDRVSKETQSRRARLFELNSDAARFFYTVLLSPQGAEAKKYIVRRGITKAMVTRFGLGAAPDSWNALYDAMTEKGYTKQELLDAGLVKQSRKDAQSVYDAFRNRLMFPVIDVRGSIIGFSGRILGDGEPKYLNSPDTVVFDKSRNLFALNLAKKSKAGILLLTEGNIDVVALHQAGFDCAVASLGTSLTEEQVRLMSRYTQNVTIAYDTDEAGMKASQRAIGILEKAGLGVRVLRMQGAKDPDEFIRKFGSDAFSLLLERSEHHVDYRLQAIKTKYDINNNDEKVKYIKEAISILSSISNLVEREVYCRKVSELVGISYDAITNEIAKIKKQKKQLGNSAQETREMINHATKKYKTKKLHYENSNSAIAEQGIIRLLLNDVELFKLLEYYSFSRDEFTVPFLAKTYDIILKRKNMNIGTSPASILTELDSEEATQLLSFMNYNENLKREEALVAYINRIRKEKLVFIKNNVNTTESDIIDNALKLALEKQNTISKYDKDLNSKKYRDQSGCGG